MYNQNKFKKLEKRLAKGINGGSFFQLAKEKQAQLARRIQRYANSLKQVVKPAILSAFLALGLSNVAQAQITFVEQTGVSNPLDTFNVGYFSRPAFADIDGDGDFDAFVGNSSSSSFYYRNTGTAGNPAFTQQTGTNNPFSGVTGIYQKPAFVDIDGDGDMDVFVGSTSPGISYYRNTGTATSPVFALQTGTNDPFNGLNNGLRIPAFVDIDNDGDMDAFLGTNSGVVIYFQNTGSATSPAFTLQSGTSNPLDLVSVTASGGSATLSFADLDNDSDFDVIVGNGVGTIFYYQNTGTNTSPVFAQQTGTNNPFNTVDVGDDSSPAFVDIDNDGDEDVFMGNSTVTGVLNYYKNTTVVGLSSVAVENTIKMFPNPTKGILNLEFPISGKMEIFDVLGQVVLTENLNSTQQLNLSSLGKGNYLVKIISENKFIVNRIVLE